MGYYVFSDYSNYYEGVRINISDIEVTQRPHVVCEYDGAAWTYPLAVCQEYQKTRLSQEMRDNIMTALASLHIDVFETILISALIVEATAFEDDTGRAAGTVPLLNGWKTETSSATLQDAADDVQSRFAFGAVVLGKAMARKMGLFDQIDAELDGETVLTYEWTPL